MSILTSLQKLTYYADKAMGALGLKEEPAVGDAKTTAKSNPVIKTNNVPENVDSIKISEEGKEKQKTTPKNERTRTAIQESIKNKCASRGINGEKLIKELRKHSGMEDGVYENLTETEKRALWTGIEQIVDNMITIMDNYNVSPEVSLEALLVKMVNAYEEDMKSGNIKDAKEMLNEAGDINKELGGKEFKNKSADIQNEMMQDNYIRWREFKQKRINQALSVYPASVREAKRKELEAEYEQQELIRFAQFTVVNNSETAFRGLRLMSPQNMAKGFNMIAESRANEQIKQAFFDDVATFNSEMELYGAYYGRQEKPCNQAVTSMHAANMAGKSAPAAMCYQNDYNEARSSGQYTQMERDGVFTQMAAGNLAGAQINQHMSVEQRIKFVKDFYNTEQKFGDLDVVVQKAEAAIEEYILTHSANSPTLRKEIEQIKRETRIHLERALRNSERVKQKRQKQNEQAKTKTSKKEKVFASQSTTTTPPELSNKENQGIVSKNRSQSDVNGVNNKNGTQGAVQYPNTNSKQTKIITESSSDSDIEFTLLTNDSPLEEIIKSCKNNTEKVYQILFRNNNLLSKYEQDAIQYIANQNKVEDLISLANSSKAIELIRNHNRVDDKEELYAKLEKRASSIQKYMFKEVSEEKEKYATA